LTALVALPLLGYLLTVGDLPFWGLITVASSLALWELSRLVGLPTEVTPRFWWPLWGHFASIGILLGAYLAGSVGILAVLGAYFVISAVLTLNIVVDNLLPRDVFARQLMGLVYIVLPLALLIVIRGMPDGLAWIVLILCLVFSNDVAAFYFGTLWGRHKLCPQISPGKTVEGLLGGVCAALLIGFCFRWLWLPHMPWGACLAMFICVALAGPAGDLFESTLKRAAGQKDSGSILPGHGGILDRIDALLFATPIAFVFFVLMGNID
jgi:phosphatidate cytidylyltransferase